MDDKQIPDPDDMVMMRLPKQLHDKIQSRVWPKFIDSMTRALAYVVEKYLKDNDTNEL